MNVEYKIVRIRPSDARVRRFVPADVLVSPDAHLTPRCTLKTAFVELNLVTFVARIFETNLRKAA